MVSYPHTKFTVNASVYRSSRVDFALTATKYIVNESYTSRVSYKPKSITIWLVLKDTNYGVGALQAVLNAVTEPVVVLIWMLV